MIETKNLTKKFDSFTAVDSLDLKIETGEFFGLLGPNGAGKSTLLKIIMQEMPADSGEVIVAKGKTLGYLAQHQEVSGDNTIYGELLSVKQYLLDMEEKIRIVESLHHAGIFYMKGAVSEVAAQLGSSEATIYRYLSKLK